MSKSISTGGKEQSENPAPDLTICHDYNGIISFTDEDGEVLYNTDRETLLGALELLAKVEQLMSSVETD